MAEPVIELHDVGVTVDGSTILDEVSLRLSRREHLAVLGPNGSGKTTLLRVLSTYRFPTRGSARVLDATFGRSDLRLLRRRIGFVSTALDPLVRARAAALALVVAARAGSTWPLAGSLAAADSADLEVARRALARAGASHLAERRVDTLSQGEWQRVRIARALATEPELLLLDEPFAGLDLGGRESLLHDLDEVLAEPDGPTVVLVTHHLEELPTGVRAAMLLREGRAVSSGPIAQVLTDDHVSAAFGLPVEVRLRGRRWSATALEGPDPERIAGVRPDDGAAG